MKTVSILCLGSFTKAQEFGRKGEVGLPALRVEKSIIKRPNDIFRFTSEMGKEL